MARRLMLGLLPALAAIAACESREVDKDLQIVNVHTGWYDAGVVEGGQNKLVPSVSFEFKNISARDIASVQVNAVFWRLGDEQALGAHFVQAIDPSGLVAGATSKPIVLRSGIGYTSVEPRLRMLQNSNFVDARVEIFGRQGSPTWVKLGEYQIDRQLLTE